MKLSRGDIYLVSPAPRHDPRKRRPVIIVSRQTLCDSKADKVICAPVNSHSDGRITEVEVGPDEGLKHRSVINCDQLVIVPKSALTNYVGSLPAKTKAALNTALRLALDI
ncbi:MAG: type II toxin-antitoxin system PemK/MazF family toxin [Gemmatimonadales bacterium]